MPENDFVEALKQLDELRASGALTGEEYAMAKARILQEGRSSGSPEAIIPEIVDEKLGPKYAKEFSEEGFWDKIGNVLKKAGAEVIYKALQLYYATQNPSCPVAVKATIYAALGYFILPLDVIPDFIPVVGFSDDLLAIGAAIGIAHLYIDDGVIRKAKDKMRSLFGEGIADEL